MGIAKDQRKITHTCTHTHTPHTHTHTHTTHTTTHTTNDEIAVVNLIITDQHRAALVQTQTHTHRHTHSHTHTIYLHVLYNGWNTFFLWRCIKLLWDVVYRSFLMWLETHLKQLLEMMPITLHNQNACL